MAIKKENQDVKQRPPLKWRARIAFAQIAFLLTGVFLTFIAYSFLHVFVERLVRGEYEQTTESAITLLSRDFSDSERSLKNAAMVMSVRDERDKTLFERVKQSDTALQNFEQIIYLDKMEDGSGWQYKNLFSNPTGKFSIKVNRKLVSIVETELEKTGRVIVDPSVFDEKAAKPASNSTAKPYALFYPVQKDGIIQGVLVGVSEPGTFIDLEWQKRNSRILKIILRDVNADYNLFELEDKDKGLKLDGAHRVYEFAFGGHRWEARTDYAKEQKIQFMNTLPYFVILFGFVLTAAGTLYIRDTQRQSNKVFRINAALEQKNRELQAEMNKRERLHNIFKKSEHENKSLIDSVSDIIFEADTTGKILFLNATWNRITGFSQEQSRGLDLFNMLHPQDQDKQRKDFMALVQGHKQPYRSFTRLRMADGSFRAIELSISMVRQDEGRNIRVVGALTDVEERRRAERALSEADKKYRAIVENAAGGIFQLTPEGLYLSVNPAMARILGYGDAEDLLAHVKNANESVYFNARERQYFLKELESAGVIHNYETQVVRKDGARVWVNENVHAVRDDAGNTLYYEGSLEDISQRKAAEMILKETKIHSDLANRAKSEFLANMSHELRTPLNSIIGFSEIIEKETFGPLGQAAYKEYAHDIHQSGRKLLAVINEILDISKIEAGERHLNDQVVDMYALIEGTIKMLENKAKSSNLFVANMMKDVPKIVGEELALKQVLMNLLSNAIKFTPSGGRVTITNDMDAKSNLRISITDTGIGLDETEIEKALSPFGQIHNEFSRSNAGTGLGLTLADALVKLHDGKLEIFSQKGIGTTVTVVFPADRVSQMKKAAQDSSNSRSEKLT